MIDIFETTSVVFVWDILLVCVSVIFITIGLEQYITKSQTRISWFGFESFWANKLGMSENWISKAVKMRNVSK